MASFKSDVRSLPICRICMIKEINCINYGKKEEKLRELFKLDTSESLTFPLLKYEILL